MTIKNIPLGLTENDLKHLTEEGKQFALEIAQTVRSNLADAAHQNEEIEKLAYLCDACDTPFDGAYECPCCGYGTATKRRVFTTPPQRTWVGLTPDEIRGISLASGESLFSAIMFTHDKLKEKNTRNGGCL